MTEIKKDDIIYKAAAVPPIFKNGEKQMNFLTGILFKIIDGFFSLVLAATSIFSPIGKELPKTPADFTPVLRFAVCSDVHISYDRDNKTYSNLDRFPLFFEDAYEYAETQAYKNVDAFVVAGDMTGGGRDEEYEKYISISQEHLREGSQLISVLGNHEFIEYRDTNPKVGYEKYKQYVNEEVDTDNVVNGFHIVGVSYSDDAKTFSGKDKWLRGVLDNAKKEDPTKPVFVIQHPAPFASVYGSVNWGDPTTALVYPSYPQVMTFSGHSHYAANDPRSINQTSYTAVNTGSLAASMVNIGYIMGDEDAPGESGTFWLVEVDAKGNVRLQLYDVATHAFFEKNEYYISDITNRSAHYYNWNNLKSHDTTPVFPDGAKATATANSENKMILSFPNAASFWGTESYQVEVSGAGKFSETVISNYVRVDDNTMNVNVGDMPSGTYKYKITPVSPYAKMGKAITGTFEYVSQ